MLLPLFFNLSFYLFLILQSFFLYSLFFSSEFLLRPPLTIIYIVKNRLNDIFMILLDRLLYLYFNNITLSLQKKALHFFYIDNFQKYYEATTTNFNCIVHDKCICRK